MLRARRERGVAVRLLRGNLLRAAEDDREHDMRVSWLLCEAIN